AQARLPLLSGVISWVVSLRGGEFALHNGVSGTTRFYPAGDRVSTIRRPAARGVMTQPKTSVGKEFQDVTLGRLVERRMVTTIYLRNRMSLRGSVVDFDPYVVILQPLDGSPVQMVYKSAIVSITGPPRPQRPGPPRGPRPGGPRSDRPYGDRPPHGDRPYGDRPYGDRPPGDRPHGDRPYGDRPPGERPYG